MATLYADTPGQYGQMLQTRRQAQANAMNRAAEQSARMAFDAQRTQQNQLNQRANMFANALQARQRQANAEANIRLNADLNRKLAEESAKRRAEEAQTLTKYQSENLKRQQQGDFFKVLDFVNKGGFGTGDVSREIVSLGESFPNLSDEQYLPLAVRAADRLQAARDAAQTQMRQDQLDKRNKLFMDLARQFPFETFRNEVAVDRPAPDGVTTGLTVYPPTPEGYFKFLDYLTNQRLGAGATNPRQLGDGPLDVPGNNTGGVLGNTVVLAGSNANP